MQSLAVMSQRAEIPLTRPVSTQPFYCWLQFKQKVANKGLNTLLYIQRPFWRLLSVTFLYFIGVQSRLLQSVLNYVLTLNVLLKSTHSLRSELTDSWSLSFVLFSKEERCYPIKNAYKTRHNVQGKTSQRAKKLHFQKVSLRD